MPFSQTQRAFVGRWDLSVRVPDGEQPAILVGRTVTVAVNGVI